MVLQPKTERKTGENQSESEFICYFQGKSWVQIRFPIVSLQFFLFFVLFCSPAQTEICYLVGFKKSFYTNSFAEAFLFYILKLQFKLFWWIILFKRIILRDHIVYFKQKILAEVKQQFLLSQSLTPYLFIIYLNTHTKHSCTHNTHTHIHIHAHTSVLTGLLNVPFPKAVC